MTTMTAGELLPVDDAARETKMSRRKLYRLLSNGTIRARKHGGRTFIERTEIARFLASLPMYQGRR